ncbi:hypothetical protein BDQ12DRAFT_359256 [Crucibulum laeve]|uniref:BZIP domain-containing protein n=1 Tax=Crucibulum laeve TaxID=68775 RepID=A0A5C3MA23_9AGAR|nr:hypothetical protein BDQ12DRAFT_359256 [Crucibulum laeve]
MQEDYHTAAGQLAANAYNQQYSVSPMNTPQSFYEADLPPVSSTDTQYPQLRHPSLALQNPGIPRRSPVLIAEDAPTQPRRYSVVSATSRKDVPSYFARRGIRHVSLEDEEDELDEEPLPATATDQEKIDYKRRQNTLAARRSRRRKLQYQEDLENQVRQLTAERETWRQRYFALRQVLLSSNLPCPDFRD